MSTCSIPFCNRPIFEHAMFTPGRELCGDHYAAWIWAPAHRIETMSEFDELCEQFRANNNDSNTTVLRSERNA